MHAGWPASPQAAMADSRAAEQDAAHDRRLLRLLLLRGAGVVVLLAGFWAAALGLFFFRADLGILASGISGAEDLDGERFIFLDRLWWWLLVPAALLLIGVAVIWATRGRDGVTRGRDGVTPQSRARTEERRAGIQIVRIAAYALCGLAMTIALPALLWGSIGLLTAATVDSGDWDALGDGIAGVGTALLSLVIGVAGVRSMKSRRPRGERPPISTSAPSGASSTNASGASYTNASGASWSSGTPGA